jgi:perosamine synthetase
MATFFAVLYQGARPIPVDIESDTWNINPELIEEKITKKTKGLLIVHIYGHPCNMRPIKKIVRRYKLFLVEDCAEAHGALCDGQKVGSFGDFGCFSFYANKIITTGEGGMLTTNNPKLAEKARSLRSLAFGKKKKFMHQDIGYGFRLTNVQAAIGYAQLTKIENIIDKKRKIAQYYNTHLKDVPGLQLPVEKDYAKNVYWMYHIVLNKDFGLSRDAFMKKLAARGIETREAFIPFNMQEIFIRQGLTRYNDCPLANYIGQNGLYLPSSPLLTKKELDYIVTMIKNV